MQIQSITVNNFKSLVDFKLDLANFSCLIGLNGSGKSTVLQFIDFLARQMQGDIDGWLAERQWRSADLKSQLTRKVNIEFSVRLTNGAVWKADFNPFQKRCTSEKIQCGDAIVEVSGQYLYTSGESTVPRNKRPINFTYQGSILSQLRESLLPAPIVEFKRFFENIVSLDLLSPQNLRQKTREAAGSLGLGGQKLAAFLHELEGRKRKELLTSLCKAYPHLLDLEIKSLRSGWKQLQITENYQGTESLPRMTTEARHINDGMLRLMAILAELQSEHQFLLFDEIENGINPELIEFLLDNLVSTSKQVLVTTHSPMILNYLDDDVAKEGVIYLYKTVDGHTQALPFFSIPSLREKLNVMGPGEAFADTNLTKLSKEISLMAGKPSEQKKIKAPKARVRPQR